ncbi:hypothetical protein SASPL_123698 [Salvia splendens]|uniref:Myb/SANT-like domain-containing protein n=1 Tax=Salvia splendens TaxID=180675 RepID=A0A8X8XP19_SALSN|nr:uncharacterized protein LOC121744083 [Salvia splendens]KAG6416272.1 hypothetical protein SASPL_123698 [Salvia splendens]
MEKAQHAVQTKTSIMLTEVDIKQRLDFLKQRYTTFKAVVGNKGASYDVVDKVVRASDVIWEAILKKTPLAAAYYHRDDPHFPLLACLYGMDDVKEEKDVSVIVLSDCTEEIPTDEPSCYEVSGFEAEVNSPAMLPPQTVRRKLFPEDVAPPLDQESTNDVGMYFIDIGPDGRLVTRLESTRVLPRPAAAKTDDAGPSTRSPNVSSVASNSPLGWWPHNIKRPNF